MDFVMGLPISNNCKGDSYDSILVIVNQLTKMVHYDPVKITIDAPGLAEVILDVVVWHHSLPDSIVFDRGSFFTSKFWSSLYYFLGIKRKLSTTFHPQTDGETKRRTAQWRYTFESLSTSNKTTGQDSYQWPSLSTTMLGTQAPVICPSNWIMASILRCHMRKKSTPASSWRQWTKY